MNIEVKRKNMQQLSDYREYLRANPQLKFLFFELTDKCNMNCLHCGSSCSDKNYKYLSVESIENVLYSVKKHFLNGSVMICLTGGEPLLHPDFKKIISIVNKLNFPWGITSNGILIDEDMAETLKSNKIGSITISLDGLETTHDKFRNCIGAYDKTLKAIKHLKNNNISVQVTTVVHKDNINELEQLYFILEQYNVKSWRVINIEPIGRALDHKELMLEKKDYIWLFDFIHEKRFSSTEIDVHYGCSHYLNVEYEHELRDNYFICGSGIYVASILCNGDIFSCLNIERRPELIQGNILKDDFVNVWNNKFDF